MSNLQKLDKCFKYMTVTSSVTSFAWGFYNSIGGKGAKKIETIGESPLTTIVNGSIMGTVYCFGSNMIISTFPITSLIIPPFIATAFIYDITNTSSTSSN